MRNYLVIALIAMAVAGCVTAEGPPQILNAKGVVARPPHSNTGSLINRFDRAARHAFPAEPTTDRFVTDTNLGNTRTVQTTTETTTRRRAPTARSTGPAGEEVTQDSDSVTTDTQVSARESTTVTRQPAPPRIPVSQAAIDEYLESGFTLVYANCNDYFWVMGQYQTGSRVGRDLIAPVITVLTGLITTGVLTDFGSDDNLLTGLTLGSAFATSGLDIYEAHFLFGAESIDSVRELIFSALAEHREKVMGLNVQSPYHATMQLIDHQAICVPAHILRLVREAIAEGRVEGTISGGTPARQDLDWRRSLASALNIQGPLTTPQAYALWRLFETANPPLEWVHTELSGLPAGVSPVLKPENKPAVRVEPWSYQPQILMRLAQIPSATRRAYLAQVAREAEQFTLLGRVDYNSLAPVAVEEGHPEGYQRVRVGIVDSPD